MSYDFDVRIVPIPLRADVIVRIAGLPDDITVAEAKRIAAVIEAYATPTTPPVLTPSAAKAP